MYGAQAQTDTSIYAPLFENDVEMYGAQAEWIEKQTKVVFENDVEMYGAQALFCCFRTHN